MKRVIYVFIGVIIFLSMCSCESADTTPKYTTDDLTTEDYEYIDTVFDYIYMWDVCSQSLGKDYPVNTISFFKFQSIDKMAFYINFQYSQTVHNSAVSSTRNGSVGFFVSNNTLERISEKTFKNDNIFTSEEQHNLSKHNGNKTSTAVSGTKWCYDGSNELKYKRIVEAYVEYLNKYE